MSFRGTQEVSAHALARRAGVDEQMLADARDLIPEERPGMYLMSASDVERALQVLAVMKTGMTAAQVGEIEQMGALPIYADISRDCPRRITAHVYRSFIAVLIAQRERGVMLDAAGLASVANLVEADPETGESRLSIRTAERHLLLLQHEGLLRAGDGRWDFSRWPAILSRD